MKIFSLTGKTAVVTGANGKLGKVWVRALAEAGAAVLATDLHNNACGDIRDLIDEYCAAGNDRAAGNAGSGAGKADGTGGQVIYIGGINIMERDDAERLCAFCKKIFAPADILVNNAGIDQPPAKDAAPYTIEDYPEDVFINILKVNTFGAFNMIQVFGSEMKKVSCGHSGKTADGCFSGGSVINIGSLYASVSPDEKFYDHMGSFLKPPSYGMSKAAVVNMTKFLAAHWGKYGIRVNTLSPGGVEGGQDEEFKRKFCARVPLGRMAGADDLTGPLVFLASDASKYVTGIELKADGGFTAW